MGVIGSTSHDSADLVHAKVYVAGQYLEAPDWRVFPLQIAEQASDTLLYELVRHTIAEQQSALPVAHETVALIKACSKPTIVSTHFSWYGQGDTKMALFYEMKNCKTPDWLVIVDFGEGFLHGRQLANLARFPFPTEIHEAIAQHLDMFVQTGQWCADTGMAKAAMQTVLEGWPKSHPLFALRQSGTSKEKQYSSLHIVNKYSGFIDAQIDFHAEGAYLIDPITDPYGLWGTQPTTVPLRSLCHVEYCDPQSTEKLLAAVAAVSPSRISGPPCGLRDGVSESEIKEVALGIYKQELFSSLNVREYDLHLLSMIFMPLAFMDTESVWQMQDLQMGMLYANMANAGPRGINGYPIFFEMRLLNERDTQRVREAYFKIEAAIGNI